MKRQEEIKLNLDSLCLYKGIFEEGVGRKFSTLIKKISKDKSIGECIKAYNEFTYELFSKSKNLSFKEAIVEEILLAHNPFSVGLEVNGEIPDFTILGIKNELKALGEIVSLNSKDIKKILVDNYKESEDVKNRINSLIDWAVDEKKYLAKTTMPFEKTKESLMNSNDWSLCAENLIDYHKNNGTGRAPAYSAFVWERFENDDEGHLREVKNPDPIKLSDLIGYEMQKEEILDNTKHFLQGLPANNLLLYGARGTGKSSTVKAILNEYYEQGLRLIEVDKEQLSDFTRIIRLLRHKKQKFIIFVDDLVFQENEASYSALKTILEGRVENRPDNILIYATTNRRHLIQEKFSNEDEIHSKDTREEQLSLADRFGITISFFTPNQNEFLKIVDGIVEGKGLEVDKEYLHSEALKWEKWHNGRSPRSAKQFINWLEATLKSQK